MRICLHHLTLGGENVKIAGAFILAAFYGGIYLVSHNDATYSSVAGGNVFGEDVRGAICGI